MGSINKEWHLANKMPQNPTEAQRLTWHIEHVKHCTCREPSPKLKQLMEEFLKKQGSQTQ